MRRICGLGAALALAGCAPTLTPLAVISPRGDVLTGIVRASMSGGSFHASNAALACSGVYDATSQDAAIPFSMSCSDGRQGIGTAYRNSTRQGGSGTVHLDDGQDFRFIFGPEAQIMRAKVGA